MIRTLTHISYACVQLPYMLERMAVGDPAAIYGRQARLNLPRPLRYIHYYYTRGTVSPNPVDLGKTPLGATVCLCTYVHKAPPECPFSRSKLITHKYLPRVEGRDQALWLRISFLDPVSWPYLEVRLRQDASSLG